jgi:hypothetical protein
MPARIMNSSLKPSLQPVFIGGYMHSGTTLLRKVLGRHSQLYPIRAETMFFEQLPVMLPKQFPNLKDPDTRDAYVRFLIRKTQFDWPPVTEDEAEGDQPYQPTAEEEQALLAGAADYDDYTDLFVYVFESIARLDGRSVWLEKTPSHIFHFEDILRRLPEARFIEMVRDPRDILASKQVRKHSDWAQQYGETAGSRLQSAKGYDPLRDSLAWKSAIKAGNQAAASHPDHILRVRYEDLAREPAREVDRLCAFLGLTMEPAMLDVGWSNTTAKADDKRTGIDASAVNKWAKRLSPDVVATCQWVCGEEMSALGYTPVAVELRDNLQISRWVARSGVDLSQRVHGLWRERGATYVQTMVQNSLKRAGFLSKKS